MILKIRFLCFHPVRLKVLPREEHGIEEDSFHLDYINSAMLSSLQINLAVITCRLAKLSQ
jgi:hypothetical protein